MKLPVLPIAAALTMAAVSLVHAQQAPFPRLSSELLDATPPSARVRGEPGAMTLQAQPCRTLPSTDTRRHIVNLAVQEWAFFGFSVLDESDPDTWVRRRGPVRASGAAAPGASLAPRGFPGRRMEDGARVAASIAGYWAVTPEGAWILGRQNEAWNGPDGTAVRWVEPWSAAFVSWVMCEAGLGAASQFQRAVAHHVYIDQAIRARLDRSAQAAFAAYDAGETAIAPGDMLCTAQRPAYRTIADRRRQMGVGARTHCDVVVKVDEERQRLLAIGGNVRGTVSLKVLPAVREGERPLRPVDRSMVEGARSVFAHLQLRADPIEPGALDNSPTFRTLACAAGFEMPERVTAANLMPAGPIVDAC